MRSIFAFKTLGLVGALALASQGVLAQQATRYAARAERQPTLTDGGTGAVDEPNRTEPPSPPAVSYRVEFLETNSPQADFAPAFYQNGLVFVTGRGEEKGLKKVFGGKTAFLDLYFLPDPDALEGSPVGEVGKTERSRKPKSERRLGTDAYTAATANDSRTVGGFAGTPTDRELGRFSRTLNTKYHEGPATFSRDGQRVVFTRNNYNGGEYRESSDKVNKLKLYAAELQRGEWANVEELPFSGDEFSTGHPAFSPDNQHLYFVSDRPGGQGGTDLYVVEYADGTWGQPRNLGPEVNTKGNEMFPFADERGNLYFASDGHPTQGGLDVFFVEMKATRPAGRVQNLGAPINSEEDDFGLITDGERSRGFFSSNRRRGGADDDLYRFTRTSSLYACRELTVLVVDAETRQPLGQTTVSVERQGSTAEAQEADAGKLNLCLDENQEYLFRVSRSGYATNTVGFTTRGRADDAPSRLEIPLLRPLGRRVTKLQGRALSQADGRPLKGTLVVLRNETDGTSRQVLTGSDGGYAFELLTGCDYRLDGSKDGYAALGRGIRKLDPASAPDDLRVDLSLFKKGDVVQVENIYYDFGKATIRPDAARELDRLVDLMERNPAMRIELRSHTDTRASAAFNDKLSAQRARAVMDYLQEKNVAPDRMVALGLGERQPKVPCPNDKCPEEIHQQNRRTEFRVLSLK